MPTRPWLPTRLTETVRHFSLPQLFHLLRSRLARPQVAFAPLFLKPRSWNTRWAAPRWRLAANQADGTFSLFGQGACISDATDWEATGQSRLWHYNLHYLDCLNSLDDSLSNDAREALLDRWIAQNPPGCGTGWEPYPLSLRIVNTIKYIRTADDERDHWLQSLSLQTSALEKRVEHHIRANHLFENGKALVFAGTFFDGPVAHAWLQKGLRILDSECREQFLSDGGHYELSPMYHGTMLGNLCDLIHLAQASGVPALIERTSAWRTLLRHGLDWYAAMSHPDGGIAFFNDAALGIAPDLITIARFAATLGVDSEPRTAFAPRPSLVNLNASGYLRVDLGAQSAAIIDVARVGPDYQPGHAHADVLSFELSLCGRRVIVNSGTSTYERGTEREAQRGTAAHSTVIIDDRNSSDTWAGFRVGRRARPQLLGIREDSAQVAIHAAHDGYRRIIGGATHRRQWIWHASGVTIVDCIDGRFRHAAAHYHLHPDVEVHIDERDPRRMNLLMGGGRSASVQVLGGRVTVQPSTWHPEFGLSIPNRRLRIEFTGDTIETRIFWQDFA